MALRKNGTIVCWGYDGYDQVSMSPEGNDFVAISAGADHCMALKRNGSVVCWGCNDSSQAAVPQTKVVESYSYDVYGNTTIFDVNGDVAPGGDYGILPDTVTGNRFMFTGREYSEFGLYYYRARYYSPKIGRFLQNDPIGYIGGLNLYSYCSNSSLNWIDPWGLKPGDLYCGKDSAGQAALLDIYGSTARDDVEYGGYIYRRWYWPQDVYSYTKPVRGDGNTVDLSHPPWWGWGGYYHSHNPSSGFSGEFFSTKPDKSSANYYNVDSYLVTPTGQMEKYDPKNPKKVKFLNKIGPHYTQQQSEKKCPPKGSAP